MTAENASLVPSGLADAAGSSCCGLSVRALNVLKLLATEITGESPTQEWIPSSALLRQVTIQRLSTARNCGPRTVNEIVHWAGSHGVTIQPLYHAGKSLSDTWRDVGQRFAAGELTRAEAAEALEKSVRRKSTRIPVAVQKILLKLLTTASEPPSAHPGR
jgi:hypothetical protein